MESHNCTQESADPFGVTRRVVLFLSPWPLLVSSPVAFQGGRRTVPDRPGPWQVPRQVSRSSWGASCGLQVTNMDPKGTKMSPQGGQNRALGQKNCPERSQIHKIVRQSSPKPTKMSLLLKTGSAAWAQPLNNMWDSCIICWILV